MLTPEEYDTYAHAITRLFDPVVQDIINDAARRIKKAGKVTATAGWELERAGILSGASRYAVQAFDRALAWESDDIKDVAMYAMRRTIDVDNKVFAAAGLYPVALADNPVLLQMVQSGLRRTMSTLHNLTATTAVGGNAMMAQTYQAELEDVLDQMHTKAVSGASTAEVCVRDAVRELSRKGPQVITYPTGHKDSLDVVVRRAVITGISQTAGDISMQNAIDMGWDLMQLSAHAGARTAKTEDFRNHAWWQGKIVSLSGAPGFLSLDDIGYGNVQGFKGANCRHDWYPHSPALKPLYTQAELDELNAKKVHYKGVWMTVAKAEIIQRGLERKYREYKREYFAQKVVGDSAAMKKAAEGALTTDKALSAFCLETKLPRMRDREEALGIGKREMEQHLATR